MSAWDDFESDVEAERRQYKRRCGVAVFLEELPKDAADAIRRALGRPELESTAIRAALLKRAEGRAVPSAFSIRHHRRADCSCAKELEE